MPSFEELESSPTLRATESETTAVRRFRVAWDDWPAFARQLVGHYDMVGAKPLFTEPIEFPGLPNLVVTEIAVEPLDGTTLRGEEVTSINSGVSRYTSGAIVTATYRSLYDTQSPSRADLPEVPPGTILTYEATLASERDTLPARTWHWLDPPTNAILLPDQSPSLLRSVVQHELTWRRVPRPPWTLIREFRGCVNDATFLGSPAGTILFRGARAERQFPFAAGGGLWKLTYVFAEKAIELAGSGTAGWNHQYKETPVSGEHWVKIEDDSNDPPYPVNDLLQLFVFE